MKVNKIFSFVIIILMVMSCVISSVSATPKDFEDPNDDEITLDTTSSYRISYDIEFIDTHGNAMPNYRQKQSSVYYDQHFNYRNAVNAGAKYVKVKIDPVSATGWNTLYDGEITPIFFNFWGVASGEYVCRSMINPVTGKIDYDKINFH